MICVSGCAGRGPKEDILEEFARQLAAAQTWFLAHREEVGAAYIEQLRAAAQSNAIKPTDIEDGPAFGWSFSTQVPSPSDSYNFQLVHMDLVQSTPMFVSDGLSKESGSWQRMDVVVPPNEVGVLKVGQAHCRTYLRKSNEVYVVGFTLKDLLWSPTDIAMYRLKEGHYKSQPDTGGNR